MTEIENKDINFKLICNITNRTYKAFKYQNIREANKTFGILGCSSLFFKKWILYHPLCDMSINNFGSIWTIDPCYPLSNEKDMYESTNWINLRPMYVSENNSKGSKFLHYLCLLPEIKTRFFLRLNAHEG